MKVGVHSSRTKACLILSLSLVFHDLPQAFLELSGLLPCDLFGGTQQYLLSRSLLCGPAVRSFTDKNMATWGTFPWALPTKMWEIWSRQIMRYVDTYFRTGGPLPLYRNWFAI